MFPQQELYLSGNILLQSRYLMKMCPLLPPFQVQMVIGSDIPCAFDDVYVVLLAMQLAVICSQLMVRLIRFVRV